MMNMHKQNNFPLKSYIYDYESLGMIKGGKWGRSYMYYFKVLYKLTRTQTSSETYLLKNWF